MSYHADEYQDLHKPWFQKRSPWITAAVFICLLAAGVGIFIRAGLRSIPDVGGTMTMEADPGTRIYIGDKLVGTTQVTISWAQLVGDDEHDPLAIELPYATSTVTPELISGPGAKILERQNLARGHSPTVDDSEDSYLMRRADGSLDHVVAYVIELTPENETRRFVILLRARKGAAGSTICYEHRGGKDSHFSAPGFVKAFGKPPIELVDIWKFSRYTPPDEFTEEVQNKGFWEPGRP